jgi:Protein of unknown function (DUF3455)
MIARPVAWLAILIVSVSLIGQQAAVSIVVPTGARQVLQVKGEGFQIYTCTSTLQSPKWVLTAPDARLLDAAGHIVGTHFAGPSWKLSDGGEVVGQLIASQPSSESDSIPWLLLRAKLGTATGSLAGIAFIRRTNTHGGTSGTVGCQADTDRGKSEKIPYTATYTFYAAQ